MKSLWHISYRYQADDYMVDEEFLVYAVDPIAAEISARSYIESLDDDPEEYEHAYEIRTVTLFDDNLHGSINYYEII